MSFTRGCVSVGDTLLWKGISGGTRTSTHTHTQTRTRTRTNTHLHKLVPNPCNYPTRNI